MRRIASGLTGVAVVTSAFVLAWPGTARAQSTYFLCDYGDVYGSTCFGGETSSGINTAVLSSDNGIALLAEDSSNGHGIEATVSGSGYAIQGTSNSGNGVNGSSASSNGVYGDTADGYGIEGYSSDSYGVVGVTNANAWAIYANAPNGDGLTAYGGASGGYGAVFYETSSSGATYGVWASATSSSSGTGVYGKGGQYGVYATSTATDSYGVYANCGGTGCTALYANGPSDYNGNMALVEGYSMFYEFTCEFGACASDRRLKKNIQSMPDALSKLLQINGVTYEWKDPDAHHPAGIQKGVIAQDVEKVLPEWVTETADGMKAVNIDQREMLGLTVEALRTLKTRNGQLRERVTALESGRQLRAAGFSVNDIGFGVGGVAIAGALVFTQRRKRQPAS